MKRLRLFSLKLGLFFFVLGPVFSKAISVKNVPSQIKIKKFSDEPKEKIIIPQVFEIVLIYSIVSLISATISKIIPLKINEDFYRRPNIPPPGFGLTSFSS